MNEAGFGKTSLPENEGHAARRGAAWASIGRLECRRSPTFRPGSVGSQRHGRKKSRLQKPGTRVPHRQGDSFPIGLNFLRLQP